MLKPIVEQDRLYIVTTYRDVLCELERQPSVNFHVHSAYQKYVLACTLADEPFFSLDDMITGVEIPAIYPERPIPDALFDVDLHGQFVTNLVFWQKMGGYRD